MNEIFDPDALDSLGQDVGADGAREFAQRYRVMLPGRVLRLQTSVADGDSDEAYVAALSLHSSSAMVGASALAHSAAALAEALRHMNAASAQVAREQIELLAEETASALDSALPEEG